MNFWRFKKKTVAHASRAQPILYNKKKGISRRVTFMSGHVTCRRGVTLPSLRVAHGGHVIHVKRIYIYTSLYALDRFHSVCARRARRLYNIYISFRGALSSLYSFILITPPLSPFARRVNWFNERTFNNYIFILQQLYLTPGLYTCGLRKVYIEQ